MIVIEKKGSINVLKVVINMWCIGVENITIKRFGSPSSNGNGAMTLSVEDFIRKEEKRVSLCFSFTHAIEMIHSKEEDDIFHSFYDNKPVLMSPDPLR